jgi:hypothetical protein
MDDRIIVWLCLSALAVTFVIALGIQRDRAEPAPIFVIVAAIACALLAWAPLQMAGRAEPARLGGLRLQLQGVSVDATQLEREPFTIGPDPSQDWLVVRFASLGAVSVDMTDSGAVMRLQSPQDGGRMILDGREVRGYVSSPFLAGRTVELTIEGPPHGESAPVPAQSRVAPAGRGSGQHDSTRLELSFHDDRLYVGLVSPEVGPDIKIKDLEGSYLQTADTGHRVVTICLNGPLASGENANQIAFQRLGAPMRAAIEGLVQLERGGKALRVVNGGVVERAQLGQTFELGGAVRAMLRIERKDLDWRGYALTAWLPLILIAITFVGGWTTMRRSSIVFVLVTLTTALAALRLIIGEEGAFVAISPSHAYLTRDGLAVLAVAPLMIAFACEGFTARRVMRVQAVATLAALLLIWRAYYDAFDNIYAPEGFATVGATVVLAALTAAAILVWPAALRTRALARPPPAQPVGRERPPSPRHTRFWRVLGAKPGDQTGAWAPFVLFLAVAGARLLMAALGVKENFRGHILLSTFTTPILVWGSAWALLRISRAARHGGAKPLLSICLWWLGLAVVMAVIAIACGDHGYVPTNLAPFVLWGILIALLQQGLGGWSRFALALPALGVVAVSAAYLLVVASQPGEAQIDAAIKDPKAESSLSLLGKLGSRNDLRDRLYAFFNPDRFDTLASAHATETRVIFRMTHIYAEQLTGRGFLNIELPRALQPEQMSDNVAAIHIMSPFGRVGATVVLWLVGACTAGATIVALIRVQWKPLDLDGFAVAALLALWTLFSVDCYMMLANVQLTVFTGRDLYLMAPISVSDLLEAMALLVTAGVGLTRRSR